MFLEILQKSLEKTCARVCIKKETLVQVFSCEFGKISKNTFYYKTPLVAAFDSLKPFYFKRKANRNINSSSSDDEEEDKSKTDK